MMELEALDTNHGARYSSLHDEVPSLEPVFRWDKRTWADNIIIHGSLQDSKPKLESRVAEFFTQADPAERNDLELSRVKLLERINAAQTEYDKKYPDIPIESVQRAGQEAKAKVKAGFRAFSETAYEYSKIMDVLIGQTPEYVALIWGAMKIVLVVHINHEELKQKVNEHMEQIKSRFETFDH